jgi:thiamine biosynthesis lipoprotein
MARCARAIGVLKDAATARGRALRRSRHMGRASRSPYWQPSRRDLLVIGLGAFVAAIPLARAHRLTLVRRNALVMGTIAEFAVAHHDLRAAEAAIDAAIETLHWVDRAMCRFNPASDVGRANRAAGDAPVSITPDTAAVLEEALAWADASDGAFDPCLARAVVLWDVRHRHEPPPSAEIRRLANRQLFRAMEVDRCRRTVRLHDRDAAIDLGGIAKGYGVDRAVAVLRDHGITRALVGSGGDLYALGTSPSGEPWRVGIQSPDAPSRIDDTLLVENAGVATSGIYEQYFDYHGTRYHHLLDPTTGAPRSSQQRSATVMAATCMAADAGATAVFGLGRHEADDVLARRGARIVHTI